MTRLLLRGAAMVAEVVDCWMAGCRTLRGLLVTADWDTPLSAGRVVPRDPILDSS